jgi:glycoprotein endo-alpha-1,2-mannosidase
MNIAGGDVAVVSWWGKYDKPYATDTQGVCTDLIMHDVLKAADEYGKIKIAFHMEPYPSRSAESFRDDVKYLIDTYGHYKSIYRENGLPWFYVYDSYHIFPSQWRRVLNPNGDLTVRGTAYDGVFIGLWLEQSHGRDMQEGGFDGIYTYFATDGFSYGSTSKNWKSMCSYCRSNQMRCVLSVGPGYNDTLIRPWNSKATRDRR